MSLILDALKKKGPIAFPVEAETAERARADAHSDTVLSTLGRRTRRTRRTGLSVRMLLLYGAAAMAIGFVGLSLLILLFAPPERLPPAAVHVPRRVLLPRWRLRRRRRFLRRRRPHPWRLCVPYRCRRRRGRPSRARCRRRPLRDHRSRPWRLRP